MWEFKVLCLRGFARQIKKSWTNCKKWDRHRNQQATHVEECVVVNLLSEEDDSRGADGVLALAVDGAVLLAAAVDDCSHGVALDADADAVPLAVRQVRAELESVFGAILLALVREAHAPSDLQAQHFVALGAEKVKVLNFQDED